MNTVKCKHWQNCGMKTGGCCAINKFNRPSFGTCLISCDKNTNKPTEDETMNLLGLSNPIKPPCYKCNKNKTKSRGLGDTVKNVISKVTGGKVKPCGGCKKRQEALNKLMPYKDKKDAN
jgi:hypothetical protein